MQMPEKRNKVPGSNNPDINLSFGKLRQFIIIIHFIFFLIKTGNTGLSQFASFFRWNWLDGPSGGEKVVNSDGIQFSLKAFQIPFTPFRYSTKTICKSDS